MLNSIQINPNRSSEPFVMYWVRVRTSWHAQKLQRKNLCDMQSNQVNGCCRAIAAAAATIDDKGDEDEMRVSSKPA